MRWWVLGLAALVACDDGGGELSSDEEAEVAYVGLDRAVSRAMDLGLQGFSLADSANIDTQTGEGDVSGTMTVDGQADQGNSDNKGLRLEVVVEGYADLEDLDPDDEDDDDDDLFVTYDSAEPAAVDLQLKGIPDGTVEGTFLGRFTMEGDLEGELTLEVTVSGPLESDGDGGTRRVAGETRVVGTATNDEDGEYEIDVTL